MDTKEKILQRASEKFQVFGVRNVTMDMLAAELGISKRTLYELFTDKDTLVVESIRHMIIQNNRTLLHIIENSDNVIEAVYLIMHRQEAHLKTVPQVFLEDIKKYYNAVNASFYTCRESLSKFSASYNLLEKGVRQGVFRKELKIEVVDAFLHELISMFHTSDRLRQLSADSVSLFQHIFLPYLRGISTPKGVELINKFFYEQSIENK